MKVQILPGYTITGSLKQAIDDGHDIGNVIFDGINLVATTTNPLALLQKKNWSTVHQGKAKGNIIETTNSDQQLFNRSKKDLASAVAWLYIDKKQNP